MFDVGRRRGKTVDATVFSGKPRFALDNRARVSRTNSSFAKSRTNTIGRLVTISMKLSVSRQTGNEKKNIKKQTKGLHVGERVRLSDGGVRTSSVQRFRRVMVAFPTSSTSRKRRLISHLILPYGSPTSLNVRTGVATRTVFNLLIFMIFTN